MPNKNLDTEIFSKEIKDLISGIDQFFTKKDEVVDNLKKVYLNCSSNN